ncbi:hypothetical protein VHEMI05088 [[Torrubiella] hemipterigena]|uniref:Structure-specific endonuclease subunit SLX4 n=1 Tax=[Torrubiella] hemipterigena TaxID=1531966 RepID=A0A0A1TG81_9HYPO|nr:hypothetical protein VHEMI05088 [[Torrubiella] hemipterigena]
MTSSAAFLSSPAAGTSPRKPLMLSSSPDLPSVDEIASQSAARTSLFFKSPSQKASITDLTGRQHGSPSPQSTMRRRSPPKFKNASTTLPPVPNPATSQNTTTHQSNSIGSVPLAEPALPVSDEVAPSKPKPITNAKRAPKDKQKSTEPLNLEMASARRTDWTPPAQGNQVIIDLEPSASQDGQPIQNFGQLLETFRLKDTTTKQDEEGIRKRKLTECTSLPVSVTKNDEKSPVKKKATKPKKKPLTITELAVAAYREPDPTEAVNPAIPDMLPGVTVSEADSNPAALPVKQTKPRKRTAKAPKKKKLVPPKQILLSPGAAREQMSRQDLIFGTSSQLAGEHSPTFLRDLAAAMRESNVIDVDDVTPINSDAIEPPPERRSLWEAAARDEEGDLFDVEIIDMVNAPSLPPSSAKADDPFGYGVAISNGDDSFVNLSDILEASSPPRSQNTINTKTTPGRQPEITSDASKAVTSDAPATTNITKPNYNLYTDTQLGVAIASYGFKEVKKRSAQIALLEKCWQSKNSSVPSSRLFSCSSGSQQPSTPQRSAPLPASQASDVSLEFPEPPPSAQPVESPKRGRGHLRKTPLGLATPMPTPSTAGSKPKTLSTQTQSAQAVIEIPDSESESEQLVQASRSSSPEEALSPANGADLSIGPDSDIQTPLSASQANQELAVFDYITKAIQSLPRSKDENNPSWHEKILMYDPIIIEELAAWLNTGTLTKMGYDDEVNGSDVKRWCESKSICCVWKINLRGNERKRL